MTPKIILDNIQKKFGNKIIESIDENVIDPYIRVELSSLIEIMIYLKNEPMLDMDYLNLITGVDWIKENKLEIVYHLSSMRHHHKLTVRAFLSREKPIVSSMVNLWNAANWHERETYDLFGIEFDNHPDLRRILLPNDWLGYPLRKDYQFPDEYHGIKWA